MNDFESLKQASYKLIAEYIEKNPADVATKATIDVIEKLLTAKDMQVDRLATEKAAKTLNDIVDRASEQLSVILAQTFLVVFDCQQ